jgi:hypothetical protein
MMIPEGIMASVRTVEMLKGRLIGMGNEVDCTVGGVRVSLPGTAESVLTRCSIHNAPGDLPDGDYVVRYPGGISQVQKRGDAWLGSEK